MNEEIISNEILIGDDKALDALATSHRVERTEHKLQEELEEIVEKILTPKEQELFYMRFGEQLPYREIARRMGYASHRTFQLQINTIIKKVRDALGSDNIRNTTSSD